MMSDYKHKSGVQKRKEKKERISKITKTTYKIDTSLRKKATSSEQLKDAVDFAYKTKHQQLQNHLLNLKLLEFC